MEGWIKLHRSILKWEWYSDENTFRLFIHLLLRANHSEIEWRSIKIKRGQLIASVQSLSDQLGLTNKQIRGSLEKLKRTGEVASERANNSTLLTLLNYEIYQDSEISEGQPKGKRSGNQRASDRATKGQAIGQQTIIIKNDKEEKKNIDGLFSSDQDLLKRVWEKWLRYRQDIRKPYRTFQSMELKFQHLIDLSGGDADLALKIVDQSIREGWTGFFEIKQKVNGSATVKSAVDIYNERYGG